MAERRPPRIGWRNGDRRAMHSNDSQGQWAVYDLATGICWYVDHPDDVPTLVNADGSKWEPPHAR